MARIKTYVVDNIISDQDKIIGTDADNSSETKNFMVGDLRSYMLSGLEPETGGNLKITTITETNTVYLTPESWINNQDPAIEVLQYEIVFLILNGRTYIFRKNNAKYGVGETQALSSDFTEIDITSVINANLQGLDSVLEQGNESFDKNAKINSLYLWDNHNNDDYGVIVYGDKDRVNFKKTNGSLIGTLGIGQLQVYTSGGGYFALSFPSVSTLTQVDFQNASGTVAYLSDIDDAISGINTGIQSIDSSDETVSIINNDGTYDLSVGYRAYVVNTQLRDSLTNTVFYQQGGVFDYDVDTIPINSVGFKFNTDIGSSLESGRFGVIYFLYENGKVDYYELEFNDVVVSGNTLTAVFPLEDYWSDVVGQRLSVIDLTLDPNCVKAVGGNPFEGGISGTISKYIYKWK